MPILVAFASGLLFGLGLILSAMIAPSKVLAFLDVFGNWDPSLAFVMAAAIPVAALGFRMARRRPVPVATPSGGPAKGLGIDGRLVAGAILFGVGWGLAGYCPGPALAALGAGRPAAWLFVGAMLVGMALFEVVTMVRRRRLEVGGTRVET